MKLSALKRIVFGGHHGGVYGLAEGASPEIIFSGSSDKFIGCWNMKTESQEDFAIECPSPVYALLYLPERNILLAGTGGGTFHEIDVAKKEITKTQTLHTGQIFDIAYSKKHNLVFTASADGKFSVLDGNDFSLKEQKQITDQKVRGFALSPDENLLAVTCGDGNIKIFALPEVKEIHSFHAHNLSTNTVCWHPGGKYLLSGGRDAHLNAWDVHNNFLPLVSIPAHNFALYHIAFSPDKKLFATASRDKSMKIWDAETFKLLLRCGKDGVDGHKNSVNRLVWNKTGLVSGADDRSLIVWDILKSD
jgi:WD40 repeat protein